MIHQKKDDEFENNSMREPKNNAGESLPKKRI